MSTDTKRRAAFSKNLNFTKINVTSSKDRKKKLKAFKKDKETKLVTSVTLYRLIATKIITKTVTAQEESQKMFNQVVELSEK